MFDPGFAGAAVTGFTLTAAPPTMFANPEFFTLASGLSKDTSSPSFGHYLVRATAVAEPATFAILGLGLAVMGAAWRRRRAA